MVKSAIHTKKKWFSHFIERQFETFFLFWITDCSTTHPWWSLLFSSFFLDVIMMLETFLNTCWWLVMYFREMAWGYPWEHRKRENVPRCSVQMPKHAKHGLIFLLFLSLSPPRSPFFPFSFVSQFLLLLLLLLHHFFISLHIPLPPLFSLPPSSLSPSSLCSKLQIQTMNDFSYFLEMLAGNFMDVVQYNEDNRGFEVRETHAKQHH